MTTIIYDCEENNLIMLNNDYCGVSKYIDEKKIKMGFFINVPLKIKLVKKHIKSNFKFEFYPLLSGSSFGSDNEGNFMLHYSYFHDIDKKKINRILF